LGSGEVLKQLNEILLFFIRIGIEGQHGSYLLEPNPKRNCVPPPAKYRQARFVNVWVEALSDPRVTHEIRNIWISYLSQVRATASSNSSPLGFMRF
jgi:hypothetical protein